MKKNLFKRGMAGLLSLVMCLTALVGIGTTTAYAAGERAEVYLVSFPRSGDANIDYSGTWGHPNLRYMNGWHSGESKYTTIRAMHSYDGNICYCIEPGVRQDTGDTYTSKDETFWDNLPSDINSTISPYDMKLFIGRIMQYGYTGPISTSWRSQNPADAATLAEAMATQVLIWETVVGERDEDFDYVSPGSYDAVKGVISTAHPLYDLFCDYYDSIEASVQRHSAIPSFMSKNPNRAQSVELKWDGSGYTATLTDHNRVLSDYSFSANEDGVSFSVSGNQLIITATDRVISILKTNVDARSDDMMLYLLVCNSFYSNENSVGKMPFEVVMKNYKELELPHFESVRRTRAKIQSEHPELACSPECRKARKRMQHLYSNYVMS